MRRLEVALEEGTAGATSLNGLLPLPVLLFADPEPNGEIGWGGFALPVLLERADALPASVALGLGWAVWYLPAFVQRPGNGPASPRSSRSPSSPPRSVMSGMAKRGIYASPISEDHPTSCASSTSPPGDDADARPARSPVLSSAAGARPGSARPDSCCASVPST